MNEGDTGRTANGRKRATSANVAQASGVSRATVSYVLNNTPNKSISEATRRLVRDTAARLGHVPSVTARTLSTGRSNIIVALVPGFTVGYVTDQALDALDRAVSARGYALLVHRHASELRPLTDLWSFIEPAFIVSMGGLSEDDRTTIANYEAPHFGVHGIIPHEEIGRMQAEYLHLRGHKRLGFAQTTDSNVSVIARERLEGVRAACREFRIAEPLVCDIDPDQDGIAEATRTWFDAGVSAVCAHNDSLAMTIIASLTASGRRVPDDLAIIGVDNVPQASMGLTTVGIDVGAYCSVLTDSVLAILDGGAPPERRQQLISINQRESA